MLLMHNFSHVELNGEKNGYGKLHQRHGSYRVVDHMSSGVLTAIV